MICWIVSLPFSRLLLSNEIQLARCPSSSSRDAPSFLFPSLPLTFPFLCLFFDTLDPRTVPTSNNDEHDDLDDEIRKLEEGEADDDHHVHQPSSSASAATLGLLTSPKSRPTSPPAVLRATGGENEVKA